MSKWIMTIVFLCFTITIVQAQPTCDVDVDRILEHVAQACDSTGRNEACYGHNALNAQLSDSALQFNQPGDIVSITQLEHLITTPYDADNDLWGISLLRVQGDFPNTLPGQNVTMLLFGSLELENAVAQLTELPGTINANARVRSTPDSNNILTSLSSGTPVVANGRNEAGDWVRIVYDGGIGWTASFLVNGLDEMSLEVVSPDEEIQTPMQALYLRPGIGRTLCEDAPDTILLHTPSDAGQSTLSINGVQMTIGSTVQVTLTPSSDSTDTMQISVLTGGAIVESNGEIALVPSGTQTSVEISTTGAIPNSIPDGVTPIPDSTWEQLRTIVESDAFNQLVTENSTTDTAIILNDVPPAEEEIETVTATQFYPGGALSGRYRFDVVSTNPVLGGNSHLLCVTNGFEREIDWDNLRYPFDGSSAPQLSDSRYGGTAEQHQASLNPSSTPNDEAYTNIVVSWVITSPTTFTYRTSAGQNRTQYGRQACDNVLNAVWIGS